MAQTRNAIESSRWRKVRQGVWKMGVSLASTYSVSYGFDRPWNYIGYMVNAIANGEAVDKIFNLCSKDELWLRHSGGGSIGWGIGREALSNVSAVLLLGVAGYYVTRFSAEVLTDWQVSDNELQAKIADILLDPALAKPIVEMTAYLLWKLTKGGSKIIMDACRDRYPERVVQYPDLNLLQKMGLQGLDVLGGISDACVVSYYLGYAEHEALAANSLLFYGVGTGGYLLTKGIRNWFCNAHPFEENQPEDHRRITVIQGEQQTPAYANGGFCAKMAHTGLIMTHHVTLAAFTLLLAEIIRSIDQNKHLNDPVALTISFAIMSLMDYFISRLRGYSNFAPTLFSAKPPVGEEQTSLVPARAAPSPV